VLDKLIRRATVVFGFISVGEAKGFSREGVRAWRGPLAGDEAEVEAEASGGEV
jgi:hypothetical protein